MSKLKICIFLLLVISYICFLTSMSSATQTYLTESPQWQGNLTAVSWSSSAFGDIDQDGDSDLVVIGYSASYSSKVYINNGTTLIENSTWQQNLTQVQEGSLAFGDIDNDGDLDLVLMGCSNGGGGGLACTGQTTRIYLNNGSTLTESSQWQNNLTQLSYPSLILGDIDNDGKLDLITTGKDSDNHKRTFVYINNGSTLTKSSTWQNSLTDVTGGCAALGDIDNDGDLDLGLCGDMTAVPYQTTKIYVNNGTSFVEDSIWKGDLTAMGDCQLSFSDFDNDGDLDINLIGCCDKHISYKNNGSTFTQFQTYSVAGGPFGGIYDGSISMGDYDNDGDLDIISSGNEKYTTLYTNNGSGSFSDYSLDPESHILNLWYDPSVIWIDLDNDNDLDLFLIGHDGSIAQAKVYTNNRSLTKNNSQSSSPNTFTSNYLDGVLNLTWNSGSDDDTPSTGLYYNLMVGNSSDNHTVVSGIYGGNSNPTAGYFGNMMQRKNISLNKYLKADTYYWYVQTIDTGLRKSNWSARQSIVIGADASVPNISSVSSSVTSSTATVTWTTNESANSTVHYGTTTSTTSSSSLDDLVISHSVGLSSLSASTLYYYNVTSCDYWNNCNTSIQYTFTTSAAPTNGGSPGGGSSNGGTTTPITPAIPEFDMDFSTSTSAIFGVKAGDIKTFSFQGEVKHAITTLVVSSNSITLLIASDPITIQVLLGETKQIDMNKDGINDLEIKLNSIISGKANFLITKLEGAEIVGEEELGKDALFDVKVSLSNLFSVVKSGREIIASIEVLNVNNIGQVDVIVDYYITSKEDNATKLAEGSDTLAVEAVASFVRTLTVPYNLKSGKYLFNVDISYGEEIMASGTTEFRVVKSYWIIISIGIIILIVAGIFFYLWRIKKKEEKDIGKLKRQISKLKNKKGWIKRMRKKKKR